ncbi:uncharacterized protein LOC109195419 isoform X1 [Oreochromis niloticus]|uniref:Uncharacterized LOC109195419 n=1 Tax=Oreochromis niloticus TaxID=8128 RepID=I3KPV0_ORENI|nr:uncharacterized protein LOC109195419 isoform X1 [Oreochromis niloticus]
MMNFTLMLLLLCTFSWISSSVAQFYTVEVQPGEEVTVKCSNFSRFHSRIFWFKMTSSPNISCISSMLTSENVFSCDGKKICLSSNTSVLFLKIKQVNSSNSGLYFCGEKLNDKLVIVTGTYLKVQELSDGLTDPLSIILSGLTVFLLLVIIVLLVKIRKSHTAQDDEKNPQHSENENSDAMNYAALSFHRKANYRRPVRPRELEMNVVYAATR